MYYDPEELLLLLLSARRTDRSAFISEHLGTFRTVQLCKQALSEGLLVQQQDRYCVTEKGNAFIDEVNRSLGRKGIERAIARLPDVRFKPMAVNAIYLPQRPY